MKEQFEKKLDEMANELLILEAILAEEAEVQEQMKKKAEELEKFFKK